MRHPLKDRKSAHHRAPGTVGVHMDPTQAGGLVYETLCAIFTPALLGAGRIVSDDGPAVSTLSFDVRKQRLLSEPVLLSEAVPALAYGRPKDVERLVLGLREHFTVEDQGFRKLGHGDQEHQLVIGPKRGS
ncbi:hypothetical protein [Streptomyces lunaelactis]|uniref:hypothetical protein n=1 Tax=Streptomyces lunaelactis TaxID=1535768 RepID=UPI0015856D1C|nr:hypothetical protein [Streptomyces lunaelactis]NUK58032.1 hypothetical protein [Streptomyces lunaelactis]